MMLRPYQSALVAEARHQWAHGARNVLMRLDTGGGKTVILATIVSEHAGASCVIAHRQELVMQLSLALARAGVRHNIIAAAATVRAIAAAHMIELGSSYYEPGARCAVASVDTLIRAKHLDHWFAQVTLWVTDEGHHLVADNKWATCVERFTHPACVGLLPTATPSRADGVGLGRGQGGFADVMVQGPPMRWLIDSGYLSDYGIVCPPSDMKVLADVGASGDWSTQVLREAAKRSHIVGDVVREYQARASGKLGITFTTDVDTAVEVTQAYRAAGVVAETLTGETQDGMRRQMLRAFAARQIHQLVVVDIISEGFDLPAVEVASFARPTASLALYMQQFGRALRVAPGKDRALIIDHVGNFLRHGPPDRPRVWTLERRGKRAGGGGDAIPLRVCLGCFQPYERFMLTCPHCATPAPPPASRSSPMAVEGDLAELDAATLQRLRGAVEARDMSIEDYRVQQMLARSPAVMANVKTHHAAQEAQAALRAAMTRWCGDRLREGRTDREVHKLFWLTWGIDLLSARALDRREAETLTARLTDPST